MLPLIRPCWISPLLLGPPDTRLLADGICCGRSPELMDLPFPLSYRAIFVWHPSLLSLCSSCQHFETLLCLLLTPLSSVSLTLMPSWSALTSLLSPHSCLEFLLPTPLPPALLMSVAGEGMARDALCHAAHAALPSWSPSFLISLLCGP